MAVEEQSLPTDFLLELFRLSLHDQYTQQIITSKIKANWLLNQEEKDFLEQLKFQSEIEGRRPSFGTMLVAAKTNKNKNLQEYIGVLREVELRDPNTLLASLEDFIKQAMFVEAYDSIADIYNKKQRKKAYQLFSEAANEVSSFSLTNDLFEPVFGNFPKRNANRIIENSNGYVKLPTGIDGLDYHLQGGPEKKELMCFLAAAKEGKSYCLTHMGVNYARRGYGVAHFQLEGSKKQCNNRYDSCWSGSLYSEIKAGDVTEEKFKNYKKIVENIGKGEIFVYAPERFQAMTVLDLRRMVIDLKKKRDISVVICDYSDLLNPDDQLYKLNDERHRQEKTMQALKQLAMELDVLVITATQASSIESELLKDPDFVIRREYLAEAKGKVRPVDYLISINRTPDERKQGVCRLFLESIRDYEGEQVVTFYQSLRRSRFYDRKKTLNSGMWETNHEIT